MNKFSNISNNSSSSALGTRGAGQRNVSLTTPSLDRQTDVKSSNIASRVSFGNNPRGFGGFIEEQPNSSSLAAAKVAEEMDQTNETTITTTNKHGVKLITRPTTSVANRLGYTGEHHLSSAGIRENPWDLDAMTARPTLVETITWIPTSTPISYNMPRDLLVSKFMSVPFKSFKYWRTDIILQFQVNASPLYQGCMMVSYIPMTNTGNLWPTSADPKTWYSINQSMYIYANTNTVAEMRIPFFHPKGYLTTTPLFEAENNMGVLVVTPLNALQSVSTVTPSVNISIYMHLENAEFKVPMPNSLVSTQAISTIREDRRALRAQGATTSSIVNNWDHVSGSSMTTKTEGDKVDLKADVEIPMEAAAAMDNPSFTVMLPNLTVKGVGHASAATGCEYLEKMSIYPGTLSTATFETFGTDIDEMMISNLKQRYSYITTFDITPSDKLDTYKLSLPMAPVVGQFSNSDGTPYPIATCIQEKSNAMYMPLISYISLPFTTWTGGITYKFQFIASAMHTCKIFVGLHYGVYDPTTLAGELDFTSQYGVAYEINQGSNELEVTAPYIAPTPYLYVPRRPDDYAGTMGCMTFSIVNALAAPSSVAQKISVNVFVAGASDFQVNGICMGNPFKVDPFFNGIPPPAALRAQSSVAPTNIAPTITNIAQDDMAGPDQTAKNIKNDHFCRDISSVRDVLRKYQFVTKRAILFTPPPTATNSSQFAFVRIDPWFLLGTNPCLNRDEYDASPRMLLPDLGAFTWFTSMYGLFRGSLRFKVFVRPQTAPDAATAIVSAVPVSWRTLFVPPTRSAVSWVPVANLNPNLPMNYGAVSGATTYGLESPPVWMAYSGGTAKQVYDSASTMVMSMVSSPSIVAEFEIPYMSVYHSVPIKQFEPVGWPIATENGLGSIYVCLDFLTDQIKTIPTPWSGATVEIYVAFGDDTRLGNFNYIPPLYLNPFTSATGTYLTSNWLMDTGIPKASEASLIDLESDEAKTRRRRRI